jgi:sirohydrochlorin cobaltochelatase
MMQGLVLFAHGSRDSQWREPFVRLAASVQTRRPKLRVRLAYLELIKPDLADAARELVAIGCTTIRIVPVFLGQGAHVRSDLPKLLASVRGDYPAIDFEAVDAVGEDDEVLAAIASVCVRGW